MDSNSKPAPFNSAHCYLSGSILSLVNEESMFTVEIVTVGWILAIVLHEFGHAIVAYLGGDKTVKGKGYLSLNPARYRYLTMSVVWPLAYLALGAVPALTGIAGPIALLAGATYIDAHRLPNRLWRSAAAAGGLIMSSIVACAFAAPFVLGYAQITAETRSFWASLAALLLFQLTAIIINCLPIPPLDGWGVIKPWLPVHIQQSSERFNRWGTWVVFGVLWLTPFLNHFIYAVISAQMQALLNVPSDLTSEGIDRFEQQALLLALGVILALVIARKYRERGTGTTPKYRPYRTR